MSGKKSRKRRVTRKQRRQKRAKVLTALFVLGMVFVMGYQGVSDLLYGDGSGENYMGQPINGAIQLLVAAVALAVLLVLAWQYIFKKGKKNKKNESDGRDYPARPPHHFPWQ